MFPRGDVLLHSAAPILLNYAKLECPTDCETQWTKSELQEAVKKGPHIPALLPDDAEQLRAEILERMKQGFAKLSNGMKSKINRQKV